jgi:hypothetical protein
MLVLLFVLQLAKKLEITQLGSLVDDPSNGGVSIHNRCSSWGGDMIAMTKANFIFFLPATVCIK